MNIEKISQLMKIGQIAVDLCNAQNAIVNARNEYLAAWRKFETGDDSEDGSNSKFVHQDERICRNHAQFEEACVATKIEYDQYKKKQREHYNIKRRLQSACRNF